MLLHRILDAFDDEFGNGPRIHQSLSRLSRLARLQVHNLVATKFHLNVVFGTAPETSVHDALLALHQGLDDLAAFGLGSEVRVGESVGDCGVRHLLFESDTKGQVADSLNDLGELRLGYFFVV